MVLFVHGNLARWFVSRIPTPRGEAEDSLVKSSLGCDEILSPKAKTGAKARAKSNTKAKAKANVTWGCRSVLAYTE